MATGILTANALDPNHLVSLCNLGSHLRPCASAAVCTPTTGRRRRVRGEHRGDRRGGRRHVRCRLRHLQQCAQLAPRPAPGRPPTPARAQHQSPPPPRARSRLPASGCCGFGFPVAHRCAPPSPQPTTTRPRSTACARSSPRSPSRARPRSPPRSPPRPPPERGATPLRVGARRARQRATRTCNPSCCCCQG